MRSLYTERPVLRRLEGGWTRLEARLNRLTLASFNPLYHLGTLSVFLLLVLMLTGIYLVLIYEPNAARAYASVERISSSGFGSLMRSMHRYAADGLVITVVLHALKMLLSDRFWGSRWLSWISGWAILALCWFIGVLGYWLVWDQRAQWLTESVAGLLGAPVQLLFAGPNFAAQTASLFVIVLFLHVFLPALIGVGLLLHTFRLSRSRWLAPRWLMFEALAVLALLSLARPVSSAAPADLGRIVADVPLDHWYLGFLALGQRLGAPLLIALSGVVGLLLLLLPWLARGQRLGPAVVTAESCTGCGLCVQECPYEAIELRPRDDRSRYDSLAVVNADRCTSCGLCVGICSPGGIDLAGLAATDLRRQLMSALKAERAAERRPSVVFACQRHLALGSLDSTPAMPPVGADEANTPRLRVAVQRSPDEQDSLVIFPLACAGMLHPDWIREGLSHGAVSAMILSCPSHDCASREGPDSLAARLDRRGSLQRQQVFWLEAAPGDDLAITRLTASAAQSSPPSALPDLRSWLRQRSQQITLRSFATGLLLFLLIFFGGTLLADHDSRAWRPGYAMLRVALSHSGRLKETASELPADMAAKLPPGVSASQISGGERYPVVLRIELDRTEVMNRSYEAAGLRNEGRASAVETIPITPGSHELRIWMMDDGLSWSPVFSGTVEVAPGQVRTLLFDQSSASFHLH